MLTGGGADEAGGEGQPHPSRAHLQCFLYSSDAVLYRLMMLSVHLSESGDNGRDWLVWAAPTTPLKSSYPHMQWPPLTEFIHRPGSITSLYTFPLQYTNLTTHKNTLYKVYITSLPTYLPSTRNQPSKASSLSNNSLIGALESLCVTTVSYTILSPLHPPDEISPSYDVVLTSPQSHHNSGVTTSPP